MSPPALYDTERALLLTQAQISPAAQVQVCPCCGSPRIDVFADLTMECSLCGSFAQAPMRSSYEYALSLLNV